MLMEISDRYGCIIEILLDPTSFCFELRSKMYVKAPSPARTLLQTKPDLIMCTANLCGHNAAMMCLVVPPLECNWEHSH